MVEADSTGGPRGRSCPFSGAVRRARLFRSKVKIMVSLMTEHEVSKRLNVSVASLRRWRLLRRGPAFLKVGSLVRYSPEDLEAWLASLPTGGTASHRQLLSGASAREVESGK
jgi:hypothetical protein